METKDFRDLIVYGMICEAAVAVPGTSKALVITPQGVVSAPAMTRFATLPRELQQRVREILLAHYVEYYPDGAGLHDLVQGLALLGAGELTSLTMHVRGVLRMCSGRRRALARGERHRDVDDRHRILDVDGVLLLPTDGEHTGAMFDMACVYTMTYYATRTEDRIALHRFVATHHKMLAPGVLSEYATNPVWMMEYVMNGTGLVKETLPPRTLLALGRHLVAVGAFEHLLRRDEDHAFVTMLFACGFVTTLPEGVEAPELPSPDAPAKTTI